jgi:phage gpG-like protein
MQIEVKVDVNKATAKLAGFRALIADRLTLIRALGLRILESIYRTFDESGSPSGSWPPLSPVSLRWNPKYTEAHKLLMDSGVGRSSVQVQEESNDHLAIGTPLKYMIVQNQGYSGPQSVKAYTYQRRAKARDTFAKFSTTTKRGNRTTVTRKTSSGVTFVRVNGFTRNIHIPARPFLVFRSEDPEALGAIAQNWMRHKAGEAGLA